MSHKDEIIKLENQLTRLFCVEYPDLSGRELQQVCLRVIEGYFEPNDRDQYLTAEKAKRELGKKLVAELGLIEIIDNEMVTELKKLISKPQDEKAENGN